VGVGIACGFTPHPNPPPQGGREQNRYRPVASAWCFSRLFAIATHPAVSTKTSATVPARNFVLEGFPDVFVVIRRGVGDAKVERPDPFA